MCIHCNTCRNRHVQQTCKLHSLMHIWGLENGLGFRPNLVLESFANCHPCCHHCRTRPERLHARTPRAEKASLPGGRRGPWNGSRWPCLDFKGNDDNDNKETTTTKTTTT